MLCNAEAHGARVGRRLYCSPFAWRLGAFAAPFVMLGTGLGLDYDPLVELFWPLVLVLFIANFFVRRSLRVELGICARHHRIRVVLLALSLLSITGVVVGLVAVLKFHSYADLAINSGWDLFLAGIIALFALALVQGFSGIQSVTLDRITGDAAWLAGTGKAFREGLPELIG